MGGKRISANTASTRPSLRQRVHIRVTYAGTGAPARELHGKFLQLYHGLLLGEAGTIEESRVAGGHMDIYVRTTVAQVTIETAWRLANDLRISVNTTVKIAQREQED
jgi:hypothetical protein